MTAVQSKKMQTKNCVKQEIEKLSRPSKSLYGNRDITEDTIYLIAIGIMRGETMWYVGLQIGRKTNEIKEAVEKYMPLTVHKVRVVSKNDISEEFAQNKVFKFLNCHDRHMYIDGHKIED